MQSYTQIPDTTSLTASRQLLLDNDQTVASTFSGTGFPLSNLVLQMWCFRTDLNQLFQLTALTPVWTMQFDLNTGARWQPTLNTAGTGTAFTITPVKPIVAYLAGQSFNVTFNAAAGASPTLQVSGVINPPILVKRLGSGAYVNIAAGDFPATHSSDVTLISPTQAWVEDLPVIAVANGGTGATTAAQARANLGVADIPQVLFSADVTLALADAGKHFFHPTADAVARTVFIPANSVIAFPIGTVITVVNQNGAGSLSLAITTDVMRLAGPGTVGTRTLPANGMCTLMKVTATEWIISGVGLT